MERFTSPENYHPTMSYNQDQSHNHKITMTLQILDKTTTISEQRFLLPGYYTWKEFEIIETLTADPGRLRITYLDGCIEFMTLGEQHESIKKILAILIEAYLFEKGINFIPVGSATRRAKEKSASFEPDESYYIGEKKQIQI